MDTWFVLSLWWGQSSESATAQQLVVIEMRHRGPTRWLSATFETINDICDDSAKRRTSGYLHLGQTENLQICASAFGGTLSDVDENKLIHFTLDGKWKKKEKKISIWIREFDILIQTSTICMKLPDIQFKKVITFDKMLITDAIPKSPPPITVTLLSCWSWCLLPPEIDMRWDNLWWSDYCLSSKTNNNCIYIVYLLPPD